MSKFCTQCGSSLQENVKFCGQCGSSVSVQQVNVIPPQPKVPIETSIVATPNSIPVGGWLLVMCLYLIAEGIYELFRLDLLEGLDLTALFKAIIPSFQIICGIMILLKRSPWIRITKSYLGLLIIIYGIAAFLVIIKIFSDGLSSLIWQWQIIGVVLSLMPFTLSVAFYEYIRRSERVKKTFPNDLK